MTRSELIEVLSFVPGFTSDMLTGLPSERLLELYSDYFEDQDMNERIKELAEQVDLLWSERDGYWKAYDDSKDLERLVEIVEAAARKDEREACAKLCEQTYDKQIVQYPKGYYVDPNKMGEYSEQTAKRCAAAIRARGEK